MKNFNLFLSFLIFLAMSNTTFAQKVKDEDKYAQAEELIDQGDFQKALTLYEELLNKNPENGNLNFKVGFCLYNIQGRKEEASIYFENAMKNVSKKYSMTSYKDKEAPLETYYYMAEILQHNYKFEEALKYLDLILPNVTKEILESVKWKVQECKMGISLTKNPLNVEEINIEEINSEFADYSPVVSGDESTMLFTSKRAGSTGGKEYREGEYFDDIYISKRENGVWLKPEKINGDINTDQHESSIGLSFDGQELLIYRYTEEGKGEIFTSVFDGNTWLKPQILSEKINSKYNEADACFSADGMTLYFTSDRPGGSGGYDIYKSTRDENGNWSSPENMGNQINTVTDERAPFMHPDGVTLFFSSNGHPSMGGLDIFYTTLENNQWTEPVNIGCPVNTPEDDICYIPTPDGKRAYYSSKKRDSKGNYDIYMLSYVEKEEQPIALISGTLTSDNNLPLTNAKIQVTDLQSNSIVYTAKPNPVTGKYIIALSKNKDYYIEYKSDNHLYHSEKIMNTNDESFSEIRKEISLSPIEAGKTNHKYQLVYNPENPNASRLFEQDMSNIAKTLTSNPDIVLNIPVIKGNKVSEARFEATKAYLSSRQIDVAKIQKTELVSESDIAEVSILDKVFYKENEENIATKMDYVSAPKTFDIVFKEDTTKSASEVEQQMASLSEYLSNNEYLVLVFNKTDSKEKIDFIVNSLIQKGVDKKRIIINPHLESVYKNKSIKINITEPEKTLALVAEKKIEEPKKDEVVKVIEKKIEEPKKDEVVKVIEKKIDEPKKDEVVKTTEKKADIEKGNVVLQNIDNKGKTYVINGNGELVLATEKTSQNNESSSTAKSNVFPLKSILFEYNETHASEYESYLNELAAAMKKQNKTCLEITGNTDSKGTPEYNNNLGMMRANYIKNFLSKKGVNTECFTVKSNGQDVPVARNENPDGSDCPDGRKFNRRVDFKLLDNTNYLLAENMIVPDNLRIGAAYGNNNSIAINQTLTKKGIVFKVQIAWMKNKVSPNFFNNKYGIDDKIDVSLYEGAYIYTIGSFSSFEDVKKLYDVIITKVNGLCFIVPFLDGKKITVQEAVAMQKSTAENR